MLDLILFLLLFFCFSYFILFAMFDFLKCLNVDMIHFTLEGFDLGLVVFFLLAKHNFLEKIIFCIFHMNDCFFRAIEISLACVISQKISIGQVCTSYFIHIWLVRNSTISLNSYSKFAQIALHISTFSWHFLSESKETRFSTWDECL